MGLTKARRLRLRRLRPSDALFLQRWSDDSETARLQGARAAPLTVAESISETHRLMAGHGSTHLAYMVEVDGATVGNCWLANLAGGSATLGIVIGESNFRGQGLGTAAVRRLLRRGTRLGVQRVTLWALATNFPALRAYAKAGFTVSAHAVRNVPRSGVTSTVEMVWRAPSDAPRK